MSVYAPLLGHLWQILAAYGLDPRQVIDAKHYRPGTVASKNKRITFPEFDVIYSRVVELIRDPALGVHSAQHLHPSHLGALGHAWMASSSLREALRRLDRYSHMFNELVEIRTAEKPDRIRVFYEIASQPSNPDILADAHLACILGLCRLNFGLGLMPLNVNLRRPQPADFKPWLEFFGPIVRFGQAEDSMDISAVDADVQSTSSDSDLVQMHEDVIRKHLSRIKRDNIANRARLTIMELLPSGRVTGEDMARELNMSIRTLRRKLGEKDETVRSLLTNVRKDLAQRYIRNEDYNITEIAFLLGFADSSAFSRAFKNWFGQSPSEARKVIERTLN